MKKEEELMMKQNKKKNEKEKSKGRSVKTLFFILISTFYYFYHIRWTKKKKIWNNILKSNKFYLQTINFDSPRGGISLVTEKGVLTTSRLLVQKAIQSDSGVYTCDPSNANPTSVRVHILNGKSIRFTSI